MSTGGPNRGRMSPVGYAVVGSEMVSFTLLGLVIDYFAGTMPWATVVLTPLGLIVAMFHLVRMTKANTAGRP